MRKRTKEVLLAAALIAGFPTQAARGSEADYPTRPITLVVPFAAGGSATTAARAVADKLGEALGQQIIIDHRAGRGGTLGTHAAWPTR